MDVKSPPIRWRWRKRSSLLIFSLPICTIVALLGLHRSFLGLEGGTSGVVATIGRHEGWLVPRRLLFGNDAHAAKWNKDRSGRPPNVLYTIFAGRKNRLLLQEPYWLEMYRIGAITEMHVWNYVTGFGGEEEKAENLAYLHSLPQKYPFITTMDPRDVPMNETRWFDTSRAFREEKVDFIDENDGTIHLKEPHYRGYSEYYKYYATHPYDGVIIKADDDIVFINTTMVPAFTEYLWSHEHVWLLSANIVNQGLCAYYQNKFGDAIPESVMPTEFPNATISPFGAIHKDAAQAMRLHEHFLASEANRQKFFITEPEFIPFHDTVKTININFIALRGDVWYEAWEIIQDMLEKVKLYYDEGAITSRAINTRGKVQGIYMPLVVAHAVAHASFSHQAELHREILLQWYKWAKNERAALYANVSLDEWKAPMGKKEQESNTMQKFIQKLQKDSKGGGGLRIVIDQDAMNKMKEQRESKNKVVTLSMEDLAKEG